MSSKRYLVTGGAGFLGSALTRRLVGEGHRVRVLDDESRGRAGRLHDIRKDLDFVSGDVRDSKAVRKAVRGVDAVCHFAFVNGTEFFYSKPDLVLEVAVKGIANVLDACRGEDVGELILASSSEVYQTPPVVPTGEKVALSVPDVLNPRYSYGGGKIISELMALNYGRSGFERVLILRPHNVYGPDMGREHVIPQFALRMIELQKGPADPLAFPVQGSGDETRAFVFIDDFIAGAMLILAKGRHLGIYNVGTSEEVSIRFVAEQVAACFGRRIRVVPGAPAAGSTARRCPDIAKLRALGFEPAVSLRDGIAKAVEWYRRAGGRKSTEEAPS